MSTESIQITHVVPSWFRYIHTLAITCNLSSQLRQASKNVFFLEFREIKIRARLPNISLTFVFLPGQISSCHWSLFANSVSLTEPLMIHTNLNLKRSQFDPRETFDVQKTGEVLGKTNRLDTCHIKTVTSCCDCISLSNSVPVA